MSTPNPFSRASETPTASGTAPIPATSSSNNPFAAFTAQAAPAAPPVSASASTTPPPAAAASNPFAAFNAAAAAPPATLTARHIDATSDATPALAPPPSAALQSAPPGNPFAGFGGARPVTAATTNAMTGFGAAGTTLPPSSGVEASAAPRPASQNPFDSFSAAPTTVATTSVPVAAPSTPFASFGSVSAPAATTVAAPVTSNPFSSFGGAPTTATSAAATASNPFASMGDSQKRVVFEQLMTDLDQGNLLVVMIKKEVLFTDVARHIHRFLPPFTVPTDGDDVDAVDAAQRSTQGQQGQRQGQEEQHHQGHQGPQGAFFAACENKTTSAGQTQAFSTASLAFAGQPNATGGSFGGVEADAQKAGGADSLHVRCAEARRAVRNVRDRDEWGPGIDWRPWVAAHDARCFTSHLRPTLPPSVLDVMIALCEPADVQTPPDASTAANESRPIERTSNEDHSLRKDDVWFACVTAPQVLRRHIQLFSRMPGLSTLILHGSNAEDLPATLETVAENCPVLEYVKLLKLRTSFVLCERSRKALWSMPRINAFSVSADSKAKHESCNSTPLLNSVLALFGAAPAPAPGFVSAPPSTSFSKGSAVFSFSTTPTSRSAWAVSERNVPEKETNPPGADAKQNSDEADTNAKKQGATEKSSDGENIASRNDVNDDESRGRAFARQLMNFHCLDLRTTQHFIDTIYARCPNLTELHCNGNMEDPVALCPVTENTTLTQVRFVRCAMDYMPSQMGHPRSEGQIHSIRFNMPRLKTLKLLTEIPILGWGVSVETRVSITPLFRLIARTKQEHSDSNSSAQEAACLALLKKPIFSAVADECAELPGAGGSNVSSGEDDAVTEQPIESHVDPNINGSDGDGLFFGCPPPQHNFQALREVTLRTMQPLGAMACLAAVPTITYVTMMSCHRIGPALFALIQRFPALERVTFTQCHLNVESDDFTGFALMSHLIRLIVHGCACDGLEFSLRTLRTVLRRGCELRLNGDRLVGGERFETVEEATRAIIQEAATEKNTDEDDDEQEDDEDVEMADGGDHHTATSLAFM